MQTMSGPHVRLTPASDPEVNFALAAHLIADGRVPMPESAQAHEELLDLMVTARQRLITSSSVFLMGEDHIALFLVTREDLAAVAPHLTRTIDQAASKHRKPRAERPSVRHTSDRTGAWAVPPSQFPVDVVASQEFAVHTAAATDAADGFPDEQRTVVIPTVAAARRTTHFGVSGRTRLLGAAAVGLIGVGLGTFFVVSPGPNHEPQQASVPLTVPDTGSQDLALDAIGRHEIAKPAKKAQAQESAAPRRAHHVRPRPRGRWMRNPIPGLPPIRLP
ncbi:MAG TPA: hypothetical protein PK331_16935 [Gordonia sp. (in: high G+C Gram-positive bacteria)]|uniref:hypothetical protein n=1 Tax=unclassified Gordonia (in: high G+C Gram-positive bacteria) TaxID=2657482 RepID=UPI0025B99C23|nr:MULTISPECIES: hypothetical protein [unclassified Gordonia (in: high G+C Gram-positive bacteria)]HNP58905.1 hypothetical protein [Gordonia sp. (in: high G+C Gram-positive bacteria)]HRC52593.1 hypothetical protein [Gordonia sp. (in: high G+C Gram-positive bacteria)]